MQTTLYRHFDEQGRLLYVGISLSAIARLAQHSSGSHWSGEIAHVTHERFPTRQSAMAAEKLAVQMENPCHNVMRFGGQGKWAGEGDYASGITADHYAMIETRLNREPSEAFFAIDLASRILSVSINTLQKMVIVPEGHIPRIETAELFFLAKRLAKGPPDLEPPIILRRHIGMTEPGCFGPLVDGDELLVHPGAAA